VKIHQIHAWDVSPQQAILIQNQLRQKITLKNACGKPALIAGADAAFSKDEKMIYAAVVVFSFPEMELVEEKWSRLAAAFPYVPGLLAFREGPPLIEAFKKIENAPDIILFDGQGIAHPRRMGIATHLGILLDKPTVGCAKTILSGKCAEPPNKVGAFSFLEENGEIVGAAVRTRKNVKPVFVSPGFKVDLKTSIEIVLQSSRGYRLPLPARKAHALASRLRAAASQNV